MNFIFVLKPKIFKMHANAAILSNIICNWSRIKAKKLHLILWNLKTKLELKNRSCDEAGTKLSRFQKYSVRLVFKKPA